MPEDEKKETTSTTGRQRRPRLTPEQHNDRINAVNGLFGGLAEMGTAFLTPFTGLINSAAGGSSTPSNPTPSNPSPSAGQEQGAGSGFPNLFGSKDVAPVKEDLPNTTPPAKKANNLPYIIGGGVFFVILLVVLIIVLAKKK